MRAPFVVKAATNAVWKADGSVATAFVANRTRPTFEFTTPWISYDTSTPPLLLLLLLLLLLPLLLLLNHLRSIPLMRCRAAAAVDISTDLIITCSVEMTPACPAPATASLKLCLCPSVKSAVLWNPSNVMVEATTETSKHVVAPAELLPVLVTHPVAGQEAHFSRGLAEYMPRTHSVHTLPPLNATVSVVDPTVQAVHAAAVATAEYIPASQCSHEVAPLAVAVFVTAPGGQMAHTPSVPTFEYLPAMH
jgi:hypothetical protein